MAGQPGLGHPPPPASPIGLPVPSGTEVDAVTGSTVATVDRTTVNLAGADGATYTYTGVTGAPRAGMVVTPGQRIGAAGPTGITFGITVPDTVGQVCAAGALQAWSVNTSIDVHALPRTCAPTATAIPPQVPASPPTKVLIVTDGAGPTAADLNAALSGSQVASTILMPDETRPVQAQADQIAGGQITQANLVVIALGAADPTEIASLMALLPAGQQVFWVAPPLPASVGATPPRLPPTCPSSLRIPTCGSRPSRAH